MVHSLIIQVEMTQDGETFKDNLVINLPTDFMENALHNDAFYDYIQSKDPNSGVGNSDYILSRVFIQKIQSQLIENLTPPLNHNKPTTYPYYGASYITKENFHKALEKYYSTLLFISSYQALTDPDEMITQYYQYTYPSRKVTHIAKIIIPSEDHYITHLVPCTTSWLSI